MKLLITIFLFFLFTAGFSQNCDCAAQLSYSINYYEQNNPAFQKIKELPKSYSAYVAQAKKIKIAAGKQTDIDQCIIYLDRYVALLKDHHSDIGFNLKRTDLSTMALIADFKNSAIYRQYRKINIDTVQLLSGLSKKKTADIEGIYSNSTSIVFGIIKDGKKAGNYIGVVLKTNKLLDAGHVLLELTPGGTNIYNVTYNTGLLGFNFKKIRKSQRIENGQIPGLGFSKTNAGLQEKAYEFKALNDSANYIRLNSFDGYLTSELDSFYTVIEKAVKSKPYLIIDIRNNGGGAERAYFNLLQYAYTRPLKIDPALIWVSPENIKSYEETSAEINKELIERMKAAKTFSFIPLVENGENTWALDSSTVFPKKIGLLFNRGTASSAEGMIHYFMQSDKVITIGENSGGYMGYGNVMTAQLPCEKFTIRSTTTKYFEKSRYEFVGIAPMYKASKKQDWILYAQQLLFKNK
jgi:hypothetical protein